MRGANARLPQQSAAVWGILTDASDPSSQPAANGSVLSRVSCSASAHFVALVSRHNSDESGSVQKNSLLSCRTFPKAFWGWGVLAQPAAALDAGCSPLQPVAMLRQSRWATSGVARELGHHSAHLPESCISTNQLIAAIFPSRHTRIVILWLLYLLVEGDALLRTRESWRMVLWSIFVQFADRR